MERYFEMNRKGRIENSDEVAVRELEEELRKKIKQTPSIRDIIEEMCSRKIIRIRKKVVEKWVYSATF